MAHKFRKKPVVIEAMQNTVGNATAISEWMTGSTVFSWVNPEFHICTLEGKMVASRGDWIIKDIKGEFYPCKPDIFEATYEAVSE